MIKNTLNFYIKVLSDILTLHLFKVVNTLQQIALNVSLSLPETLKTILSKSKLQVSTLFHSAYMCTTSLTFSLKLFM